MLLKKGQVMVEVCLVFPIVILLIFSIIQLSLYMNSSLIVNYAAYCAARSLIVHSEKPDRIVKAKQSARMILSTISIPKAALSRIKINRNGNEFSVSIYYPYKFLFQNIKGHCTLVTQ